MQECFQAEFQETCEDLLHDAILIYALTRLDNNWPAGVPVDEKNRVWQRLSDYLMQHAMDLKFLIQKKE